MRNYQMPYPGSGDARGSAAPRRKFLRTRSHAVRRGFDRLLDLLQIERCEVLLASAARFQFLHDLVQVEAGRFLPLRELFESGQELPDVILCRDKQIDVIQ